MAPVSLPAGRAVTLPPGRTANVAAPASSANLGPGFDALGLALDLWDRVEVETASSGLEIEVSGAGEGEVPLDERHLVVRTLRRGLGLLGVADPMAVGLRIRAHNAVPHGRGLGSSAAAIVAGLAAAWRLVHAAGELDTDWLLDVASDLEGHPDNASAAVLGGFTVSWFETPGLAERQLRRRARAVTLPVAEGVAALLLVPTAVLPTEQARAVLPATVPHADAANNAGRAALLTHALTAAPDLLLPATEDWLHQRLRAPQMPESFDLVRRLRADGHAAVVSGAGPSVLVLGRRPPLALLAERLAGDGTGFSSHLLAVGGGVSAD